MHAFKNRTELEEHFQVYYKHNNRLQAVKMYYELNIGTGLSECLNDVNNCWDENFGKQITDVILTKSVGKIYLIDKETLITPPVTTQINKVKEFMIACSQDTGNHKKSINRETAQLRLNLLLEELHELADAFGLEKYFQWLLSKHIDDEIAQEEKEIDNVAVLDANADLLYILYGTIIAAGQEKLINPAFDDVHESNMSKTIIGFDEAVKQADKYNKDNDTPVTVVPTPVENVYCLVRTIDNKVVKPSTYKPVNLKKYYDKD